MGDTLCVHSLAVGLAVVLVIIIIIKKIVPPKSLVGNGRSEISSGGSSSRVCVVVVDVGAVKILLDLILAVVDIVRPLDIPIREFIDPIGSLLLSYPPAATCGDDGLWCNLVRYLCIVLNE